MPKISQNYRRLGVLKHGRVEEVQMNTNTFDIKDKQYYIDLFRRNGFNCFPIPQNQKVADARYKASRTVREQPIRDEENYGIIPIKGNGNCIIDLDDKERYRNFAELVCKEGYVVCETGRGWHIPVIGVSGLVQKTELYDYGYQPNEKIIEIQGPDHYCVGIKSEIFHEKLQVQVRYENVGGEEKIWDINGRDFHRLVDNICESCNVESRRKSNRSSTKYLRDRFLQGRPPKKGSSNDYFFQAAIQCNTDNLTEGEAVEKIRNVYEKWVMSDSFSQRPFSNIETKIREVYEKNMTLREGRPAKNDQRVDRREIAQNLISQRKIYSNAQTHEIFEDRNGFLQKLNYCLKKELQKVHPEMERSDYEDILFKLEGLAPDMPPTNKDLIVFRNGKYDKKTGCLVETDDLADMGFENFDYLPKNEENKPKEFMKILYGNVPKYQHPRINAGLRSIFNSRVDSKISIIYGNSGTGKSTPLVILVMLLGDEYGFTVELNQFLNDRATRAKIIGKRLLVFQDLPKEWKDFTTLKTITGELRKSERGFHQDEVQFDNKLKIWASGNYLAEIPQDEKDAMYTRRLSLIHNTRTIPYEENSEFVDDIISKEGEKIVSWIVNLADEQCQYEDKDAVQKEWEGIASPEIDYLQKHYQNSVVESNKAVMVLVKECKKATGGNITLSQMLKSLRGLGYVIRNNIVTNIEDIIPKNSTLM
jgi:phage/plasmid-associated DNA primase